MRLRPGVAAGRLGAGEPDAAAVSPEPVARPIAVRRIAARPVAARRAGPAVTGARRAVPRHRPAARRYRPAARRLQALTGGRPRRLLRRRPHRRRTHSLVNRDRAFRMLLSKGPVGSNRARSNPIKPVQRPPHGLRPRDPSSALPRQGPAARRRGTVSGYNSRPKHRIDGRGHAATRSP